MSYTLKFSFKKWTHDCAISNMAEQKALKFKILAKCSRSKARVSVISLPHYDVDGPVFMPVGTQGTLKGMTSYQLEKLDCHIILGNTYHLGMRPGTDVLEKVGGLHNFMNWKRAMLTDSGGFQMVSLLKLSEVTEEGVKFQAPHDGSEMLLSPEKSMEIQNAIGADIMMQLDDVISSLTTGPRVEEAMYRSIRWLDRCVKAHKRQTEQNLFPIIQGGLDPKLREICCKEMVKRDCPGYAIGGLSGGEEKEEFWKIVSLCTDYLPENKPRYCMGIGYTVDLIVCVALGADMFDCVYPTRTARFGSALTATGQLSLRHQKFASDFTPIECDCLCSTCRKHSRAYVHSLFGREAVGCHLITVHNIYYQMRLMKEMRNSIMNDTFPDFVKKRFNLLYPDKNFPQWALNALASVGITLE